MPTADAQALAVGLKSEPPTNFGAAVGRMTAVSYSNFICFISAIKRGSLRRLFHFGSTLKKVIRTSLAAKPFPSRDNAASVSPRAL